MWEVDAVRKVGSDAWSGRARVEYDPQIPTLLKQEESDDLD